GENFNDYASEFLKKLKEAGIRVEIDDSSDSLNKKVRNAEQSHINYILVVGEQEQKDSGVAVRNYKTKEQSNEKLGEFISRIKEEIVEKKL
ncbi:MAG: His/Gly/Thr/Pro-type tRNA ligase C-terminal domain-containing protein, partial [Candidatus Gracilibacteria bacterium]|nr:His/Gly/Thr/Pro-type tRNA ligase C-terminal domain-containing protein [Candidatus Gracilibacteria bacterium]